MKVKWIENPTEAEFPLIDRCINCGEPCAWQPRFEIAARSPEHKQHLFANRRFGYIPESRIVKICGDCLPKENVRRVRAMVKLAYPKVRF